jgi:hypothetical protein
MGTFGFCMCEEQAWCKDDDGMEMKIKYWKRGACTRRRELRIISRDYLAHQSKQATLPLQAPHPPYKMYFRRSNLRERNRLIQMGADEKLNESIKQFHVKMNYRQWATSINSKRLAQSVIISYLQHVIRNEAHFVESQRNWRQNKGASFFVPWPNNCHVFPLNFLDIPSRFSSSLLLILCYSFLSLVIFFISF